MGVAAALDQHVERLHHARADVRVGEHLAAGDRGAGAGEVLELRLVGVQLRSEARKQRGDRKAGRCDRERAAKHEARPAAPGSLLGMAAVDEAARYHAKTVDALSEHGQERR